MFVTTCLIALQMRYVKGWPLLVGVAFFLVFGFFDGTLLDISMQFGSLKARAGLFWGASLKKVPHGAWVPLMIGVALYVLEFGGLHTSSLIPIPCLSRMLLMIFWTWAKVCSHCRTIINEVASLMRVPAGPRGYFRRSKPAQPPALYCGKGRRRGRHVPASGRRSH